MLINFTADSLQLRGKLIDGTWKVTLTVGEYESNKLKDLLLIGNENLKITIETEK